MLLAPDTSFAFIAYNTLHDVAFRTFAPEGNQGKRLARFARRAIWLSSMGSEWTLSGNHG